MWPWGAARVAKEAIDVWPRGVCWLQAEACQVNVLRASKFLRVWRVWRVWRVGGHKKPLMCGLGVAVGCRMKHALRVWMMCGLGKRRRSLERQNLQTKPAGGKLTWPKHVIFMSKSREGVTGGRSMPGKCVRDVALRRLAGCEMGSGWLAARWVWPWKAKKEPWKTKPADKTFRRKTYWPKACNFHVQMPGSLNEEGEVPHLRWSQAPPLPWPRPGSADIYASSLHWQNH